MPNRVYESPASLVCLELSWSIAALLCSLFLLIPSLALSAIEYNTVALLKFQILSTPILNGFEGYQPEIACSISALKYPSGYPGVGTLLGSGSIRGCVLQGVEDEQVRFSVLKDDKQTRCAVCSEPFIEEWDSDLQEWVYADAVRLPPFAANDPAVGVEPGKIVKVSVLPSALLPRLEKHKRTEGTSGNRKRKAAWDGEDDRRVRPQFVV
jgi:hypothetical protein